MSKHREQHFVPRSYLKPWCDPESVGLPKVEPYVWVFDKDGSNPKKRAPKNILWEPEMYTRQRDGQRDLGLEKMLIRLEHAYAKLLRPKLAATEPLGEKEHELLCLYIAAAHARTRMRREHHRAQWQAPLAMMDELKETMKHATIEQKKGMARIPTLSSDGPRLSHEQVRELVEQPLQCLLAPEMLAVGPKLMELDFAVLLTDDEVGFITSDRPCMWYDSEAYRRHPFYRAPSLAYDSIEISFPISPSQCILLNRMGLEGYGDAAPGVPDMLKQRARAMCHKQFVARKNQTKPAWFEVPEEPEDSWEKTHRPNDDPEPSSPPA